MRPQSQVRRRLAVAKRRTRSSSGAAAAGLLSWRARREPTVPGVTVLTVNWNTLDFVRVLVRAVRRLSPSETRIVVVDNGSTDGSVDYLLHQDGVEVLRLPLNFGHGVGLDFGMSRVRTEYVAVLDVDAFPISPDWLNRPLAALQGGAQISGGYYTRNYIHPSYLVTRRDLINRFRLTFRPRGSFPTEPTCPLFLDVGEALSQSVAVKFGSRTLDRIEVSEMRGPGMVGTVYGGLVYHNYFATQGVFRNEALGYWSEAVETYLGDGSQDRASQEDRAPADRAEDLT